MSSTDRQNRLLVAEDWKRIYQSYRNANFQSYDFETLRRVMISYIRENYPEDFNDYIESSEYLALIDLIAFLGQSISFRVDLNARDNFLELAERRESVLRLARLLSYNAKRNIPASGLLKFNSVSTTQNVFDSNGRNLAGQIVVWNDPANSNWYDQFIKIINSALPATRQFGNPDDKATIQGIPTEQYRFQAANADVPVYSFTKTVDGRGMNFEIVSSTFKNADEIYEEPPLNGNRLAFVYRNDSKGTGSSNTGFFLHFRQGILNQGTFTISQPSTSETVDIDAVNINDKDVWLYKLDSAALEAEEWAKVPSLEGNNIIYNSLQKNIRNIFGVITRANDRISLIFSDGTFGNLPRGTFRAYYRTSNGISYTINPKDIKNVSIEIPYVSNTRQIETLTINLNLMYSIDNASETESNASIKSRAPSTYYTQNRMITAEDYNVSPLSVSQEIVKIKAINRSSSGISRYFDLVDPTGKYSKTNIFADDGALYKEEYTEMFRFKYTSRSEIEAVIYNQLLDVLKSPALRDFYYSKYPKVLLSTLNVQWYHKTFDANITTGYIGSTVEIAPYKVSDSTKTNLRFVTPGSLLKFVAPAGMYFNLDADNTLTVGSSEVANAATVLWTKVISIVGDGTVGGNGELADGTGPIVLSDIIPTGAVLDQVIPTWRTTLDAGTVAALVDLIFANKPFGLRYDIESRIWKIVLEADLDTISDFSLGKAGDTANEQADSSWMLVFTTDTEYYTVQSRLLRYIFESSTQVRFFFDESDKIYDARNNVVVKDNIKILSVNSQPTSLKPFTYDRSWEIVKEYIGLDGYVDSKKIQITFSDHDDDGTVDNPDIFEDIVSPDSVTASNKYVILERYEVFMGQEDYRLFTGPGAGPHIVPSAGSIVINDYPDGSYFYLENTRQVVKLNRVTAALIPTLDYKVYIGRKGLKFQYIHNADYESRIDPGLTNIIDVFVLTKQYDRLFRQWVQGSIPEEPLPLSTDAMYGLLANKLNHIKSISDEIIYHPVKYKILFGSKASPNVQATFKVTKNLESVISDNDVRSRVLSAINEFFSLENWDFGDSFYFTELSSYVMNKLSPNIVNFVIVPRQGDLTFGSLFEIKAEKDQLFINGATIDDIEIISAITSSTIRSSGIISTKSTILTNQSITSSRNV
jgi:hypothetical protein